MMVSPELLRRYPYFAGISEESLKRVAMIAEPVHLPAEHVMFYEHDPADHLYVIVHGEVDVKYTLGTGEQRTVDTLTDGDLLVWSALVAPYRMTGMGMTTKPTDLVSINSPELRKLCEEDPRLGYALMTQVARLLANRLEGARVQLAVV